MQYLTLHDRRPSSIDLIGVWVGYSVVKMFQNLTGQAKHDHVISSLRGIPELPAVCWMMIGSSLELDECTVHTYSPPPLSLSFTHLATLLCTN